MSSDLRQRVEEIFHRVAELPREERERELAAQAVGDANLLREVRGLLAAIDGEMGEFLVRPPVEREPTSPDQPMRVGHYQIIRKVGEGGMGVVYEARQDNPRRTVALKLIRPGFVSAHLLKRFEHEAQILGQLQHPGIAQIYEAGTADVTVPLGPSATAGGMTLPLPTATGRVAAVQQPYFAMEFVRGKTLTQYAEDGGLGTRERLDLFSRVCDAVHYAHTKGVIHRDLKPGNILVDEVGAPKILDFGVARATNADTQTATLRTDVGQLIGTLPYMSPEQVGGDPAQVDHRSDVYALGVTLYELLVGRTPHDLRNRSIPEAARIIREEEPTRLSSINPQLRGDIETIVGKAIEKEKLRRYASVAEMAADIRHYLQDEPIQARPVSTWYQLRKFSRRNRGLVVGLATAALMLVATVIATSSFALYASRQRKIAEQRTAEVTRQAYRASIAAASSALGNGDIRLAQAHLAAAPVELRGWEWDYLNWTSNRSVRTFAEKAGWIEFLSVTGDGRRVVTGAKDGHIRIWDLETGKPVGGCRVPPSGGLPYAVVRPDGKLVLVPDDSSGEVVMRDVETGEPRWRRPSRGGGCGFSPDGTRVAVLSASGDSVELLDAETGQLSETVPWNAPLGGAVFGPDDSKLRLQEASGCTRLIHAPTRRVLSDLCIWGLALDRDWTRALLNADYSRTWRLLSIPDGRILAEPPQPMQSWPLAQFFADGKAFLTVEPSGVFSVFDQRIERVTRFFGPPDTVRCQLTPDERHMVTATRDGTIHVWKTRTVDEPLRIPVRRSAAISSAAVAPSGEAAALGGWGDVALFETRSGALRWRRTPGRGWVTAVGFSSDGARLVTGDHNGRIQVRNSADGAAVADLKRLQAAPLALRWVKKGGPIVAGLRDGRVALIDPENASGVRYLEAHASPVHCLALSADQSLLASGSGVGAESQSLPDASAAPEDNSVRLWDAIHWTSLRRLEGHSRPVTGLAFHPEGRQLASGAMDGVVLVWDARSGNRLATIADVGETRALAFSPDGQRLAAVCTDGALRIWDTANYEELLTLRTGSIGSLAATFSPDGRTLVATGGQSAVLAFETGPTEESETRFNLIWSHRFLEPRVNQLADDTLADLQNDVSLPPEVRAAAVRHVRIYGDHANYLNSEAIIESRRVEDRERFLASARRKVESALRILPDDPGYLSTLGAVLCQQGDYGAAVEALSRSTEGYRRRGDEPVANNWAYMAIAHHHLGRTDEARKDLEYLRTLRAPLVPEDEDTPKLREAVESLLREQSNLRKEGSRKDPRTSRNMLTLSGRSR